jgi:hypothetical protein
MYFRSMMASLALAATVAAGPAAAQQPFDESKYPPMAGQWHRVGPLGVFDSTKPIGPGQQAPLTPEYQAIFEANAREQAAGGQGTTKTYRCFSPGMPRVTNGYGEIEFVVTPKTTHILVDHIYDNRRIFTDGRPWPVEIVPTLLGYSMGQWVDTDGDGRYDVLEVETRGLRGPRSFDASGLPLHADNQTVVKEKIYIDKNDPNVAHDEVTVIDNALTRPWTVTKNYRRSPDPYPAWSEENCGESNNHVTIADEDYMLSAEGFLMPTRKNQAPPNLKYFKQLQR